MIFLKPHTYSIIFCVLVYTVQYRVSGILHLRQCDDHTVQYIYILYWIQYSQRHFAFATVWWTASICNMTRMVQSWALDNTASTTGPCLHFTGHKIVSYCITPMFVVATPFRSREHFRIFFLYLKLYCVVVLSRS